MEDITRMNVNTNETTRRGFLKTTAGTAGAAMLGGLNLARSAHAAGSDVLRVGLIGCGDRGRGAAVNALNADKNAKLVAIRRSVRGEYPPRLPEYPRDPWRSGGGQR